MTDNDFLQWMTSKLTLNQYRMLAKIVYSFKKYTMIDEPKTAVYCNFKDIRNHFVASDIPKFFDEMSSLTNEEPIRLFDNWYNDNVIFWPYEETPELVKARERLMKKCENHSTPYRYLYIFRENEHGEIMNLVVVNKCFSGSPLWEYSLDKWVDIMWRKANKSEDSAVYIKAYNTKLAFKHCLGLSNKQYKELTDKYPYYTDSLTLNSYESSVYRSFSKIFDNIVDVPINAKYLLYLYYKYIFDIYGIHPEGTVFISDIIIGIAELKERGELK